MQSNKKPGPGDELESEARHGRDEEAVQLPIDGILDLHTFDPKEVKDLVPDYIAACRERNILQIRIIHGKGAGVLLQTVHAILGRSPEVAEFHLADSLSGGWGATVVTLFPKPR